MSNYPPGVPEPLLKEEVSYWCPECDRDWKALYVKDMGTWSIESDNDSRCPGCGKEGVECLM